MQETAAGDRIVSVAGSLINLMTVKNSSWLGGTQLAMRERWAHVRDQSVSPGLSSCCEALNWATALSLELDHCTKHKKARADPSLGANHSCTEPPSQLCLTQHLPLPSVLIIIWMTAAAGARAAQVHPMSALTTWWKYTVHAPWCAGFKPAMDVCDS
jgi:hypothetical protein